ncbi:MAG: hypothetical protein WC236_14930 [Gallionellaceae bacterium]|jgi:hypothetical protein
MKALTIYLTGNPLWPEIGRLDFDGTVRIFDCAGKFWSDPLADADYVYAEVHA